MGTDIHMFVERKLEDGTWQAVRGHYLPGTWEEAWVKSKAQGADRDFQQMLDENQLPENLTPYSEDEPALSIYEVELMAASLERGKLEGWLYNDRNYDLFAMLADVRNGRGFAGVVTGEGFNVIAEPKGLPEDLSEEILQAWEYSGDHTPSWLTLRELQEYDWKQSSRHTGLVTPREYLRFRETGTPISWYGEVWGNGVEIVSNEEMEAIIASGERRNAYTRILWESSYEDSARHFLETAMPRLEEIGGAGRRENRLLVRQLGEYHGRTDNTGQVLILWCNRNALQRG